MKKTVEIPTHTRDLILAAARSLKAQKAGSVITPKKSRSSAKNGKLGGRPRKAVAA